MEQPRQILVWVTKGYKKIASSFTVITQTVYLGSYFPNSVMKETNPTNYKKEDAD